MESTLPFHQRLLSIKSFQDPQLICWNRTQIVFFQVELVVLLHSVPVLLFRKLKQSFVDVIQDSCSWKICNIHSEKSVLVSLFIEGAGLTSTKKTLQHRYFSVNIAKEYLFQQNTSVGCFWVSCDYHVPTTYSLLFLCQENKRWLDQFLLIKKVFMISIKRMLLSFTYWRFRRGSNHEALF